MKQASDLPALCSPARDTSEDYLRIANSMIDLLNYSVNSWRAEVRKRGPVGTTYRSLWLFCCSSEWYLSYSCGTLLLLTLVLADTALNTEGRWWNIEGRWWKPLIFGEGNMFASSNFVLFKGTCLQNKMKQGVEGRAKTSVWRVKILNCGSFILNFR